MIEKECLSTVAKVPLSDLQLYNSCAVFFPTSSVYGSSLLLTRSHSSIPGSRALFSPKIRKSENCKNEKEIELEINSAKLTIIGVILQCCLCIVDEWVSSVNQMSSSNSISSRSKLRMCLAIP